MFPAKTRGVMKVCVYEKKIQADDKLREHV